MVYHCMSHWNVRGMSCHRSWVVRISEYVFPSRTMQNMATSSTTDLRKHARKAHLWTRPNHALNEFCCTSVNWPSIRQGWVLQGLVEELSMQGLPPSQPLANRMCAYVTAVSTHHLNHGYLQKLITNFSIAHARFISNKSDKCVLNHSGNCFP